MRLRLGRFFLFLTLALQSVQLAAQQGMLVESRLARLTACPEPDVSYRPDVEVRQAEYRFCPRGFREGQARPWYLHAEFLSLCRSCPRPDHFSADQYAQPDNVVLGTDNLSFDHEPGMRFTLGRRSSGSDMSVEFSYFGILDQWNSTASYTDESPYGGLESNLTATFFSDAGPGTATFDTFRGSGTQAISYTSELHACELNVQRHFEPWISSSGHSLAGLRFVTLDEDFVFTSHDTPTGEVGEYLIATENRLLGLQIGGDLAWQVSPRTALCLWAKVALLLNFSNQNSRLVNSDTGSTGYDLPINTGDVTDGDLASLAELGLSFHFAVTRRIELRAGYEAMLLSGLTLAPEQFDHTIGLTMARKIDSSGQMLVHGASVGGTCRW
ncbi:MAG: BBP7 family outer membrane beta-barrel protein [Pirellulales bacterium]|nr:BBP7 family outer membrane beta-barrel protein [Pirellulales bacterium]